MTNCLLSRRHALRVLRVFWLWIFIQKLNLPQKNKACHVMMSSTGTISPTHVTTDPVLWPTSLFAWCQHPSYKSKCSLTDLTRTLTFKYNFNKTTWGARKQKWGNLRCNLTTSLRTRFIGGGRQLLRWKKKRSPFVFSVTTICFGRVRFFFYRHSLKNDVYLFQINTHM